MKSPHFYKLLLILGLLSAVLLSCGGESNSQAYYEPQPPPPESPQPPSEPPQLNPGNPGGSPPPVRYYADLGNGVVADYTEIKAAEPSAVVQVFTIPYPDTADIVKVAPKGIEIIYPVTRTASLTPKSLMQAQESQATHVPVIKFDLSKTPTAQEIKLLKVFVETQDSITVLHPFVLNQSVYVYAPYSGKYMLVMYNGIPGTKIPGCSDKSPICIPDDQDFKANSNIRVKVIAHDDTVQSVALDICQPEWENCEEKGRSNVDKDKNEKFKELSFSPSSSNNGGGYVAYIRIRKQLKLWPDLAYNYSVPVDSEVFSIDENTCSNLLDKYAPIVEFGQESTESENKSEKYLPVLLERLGQDSDFLFYAYREGYKVCKILLDLLDKELCEKVFKSM